jgi:hypothetical protein
MVLIMNRKNTVKIVKRVQRDHDREGEAARLSESLRKSTREVVSDWVKEFQQRRHVDPRRSFASLFKTVDPSLASS